MQLYDYARKALEKRAERIEKTNSRQANVTMNLIKAYGIIYVVSFHLKDIGIDFPMTNWLIHSHIMFLFMFVSGYFYKPDSDNAPLFDVLTQKARTTLLPYFTWNLFYLILTTFLNAFTPLRYGDNLSLYSLFIRPWTDHMHCAFMVPGWYILILFCDMALLNIIRRGMKKMHVFNEFAVFVLTLCFSVCAIIFSRRGWLNGFMPTINKTFYLMPALQMGIIYRQYENFFCRRKALSIGAIMALIFIINAAVGKPYDIDMLSGRFIGNPAHIISWSLLCVLLTVIICEALAPAFRENKIVKAIGENSFSPMMHHMAVITLINAGIYVLSRFISMDFKADKWFSSIVYVYPWRNGNITFFYTILCIAVPVLIKIGVDKLVLRLNARLSRAE